MRYIASVLPIILLILSVSTSEARKRLETYVDNQGARRVVGTHKIYRDYAAVKAFKKKNPQPNDGHAYDIHHVKSLKHGGADKPSNMQWIRTVDHRRKRM